jgi:putative tricarboxylic transport membrane protein
MAEERVERAAGTVQTRWAELAVALLLLIGGAVVVLDSYRVGAEWGEDGPKAGYFPHFIGYILCIAAIVVAVQTFLRWRALADDVFVTWAELKPVLTVLVPTIVYVGLIATIGIYVASAIYITGFMMWQGKFRVLPALAAGVGVPVAIFLLFEVWFLIPLPKGPLEHLLGY